MSRATLIYIFMLAVGVGGIWLILGAGARLEAPTDLTGVWDVGGEDPAAPLQLGETLTIDQSGQFFRLSFAKGLVVDAKLKDESKANEQTGQLLDMILEGPQWKVAALGDGSAGPLLLKMTGPEKHTFTITRSRPGGADDKGGANVVPTATADATEAAAAPAVPDAP